MPMDFPDMRSLTNRAAQRGFRAPFESESEEQYRDKLADFMFDKDRVESGEIRGGLGWDKTHILAFGMLSGMLGENKEMPENYVNGIRGLVAQLGDHNVALDDSQMQALLDCAAPARNLRTSLGFLGRYSQLTKHGAHIDLIRQYLDRLGARVFVSDELFIFGKTGNGKAPTEFVLASDDLILGALFNADI